MLKSVVAPNAVPLDLCSPAVAAGFTRIELDQDVGTAIVLYVASQPIRVRYEPDLLREYGTVDAWQDALRRQPEFEHYVVVSEANHALIPRLRHVALQVKNRKIEVGSYADYCSWASQRLGPFSTVSDSSPVRQLLEHLLCLSTAPTPTVRDALEGDFSYSAIKPSFDLGALGVQALATLLKHTRGPSNFFNLEADRAWQSLGVDLHIRASTARRTLSTLLNVEVKTENFTSGNITLEDLGNVGQNTLGWLHYSQADVLVVCMWPTGEVFFLNFKEVRDWALKGNHNLRVAKGKVPEQPYFSRIFLAPISTLMETFKDTVYLRLIDWLPLAYEGQFNKPYLTSEKFASRKLTPVRLAFPLSGNERIASSLKLCA